MANWFRQACFPIRLLGIAMSLGRKLSRYNSSDSHESDHRDQMPSDLSKCKSRIMYIEDKSGGLVGAARIGRVYFSKTGKSLYYNGKTFRSLKGAGFKANYFETQTLNHYWISGPRRDQDDRLYGGFDGVEIDDDVRLEYQQTCTAQPGGKPAGDSRPSVS